MVTTAEFAKQEGITRPAALRRLRRWEKKGHAVERKRAIIGYRISKSSARPRGKVVPVYGSEWEVTKP